MLIRAVDPIGHIWLFCRMKDGHILVRGYEPDDNPLTRWHTLTTQDILNWCRLIDSKEEKED